MPHLILHAVMAVLLMAATVPGSPGAAERMPPQFAFAGDRVLLSVAGRVPGSAEVRWDFGDGASGGGAVAVHRFAEPGVFEATARVETGPGEVRRFRQTVHVKPGYDIRDPLLYRGVLVSHVYAHLNFPWAQADAEPAERANAFHDLAQWERTLDDLRRWGYNAVCFLDKHPFPQLVQVPGFPEAQTIGDAELARNRKTFRAVLRMARERGMRVDVLVYNIHTPLPVSRKHGFDIHDDTPVSRRYTAAAVSAFYREFPGIGRLVLTVGESPPGCVDFCRRSYVEPLIEMRPQPGLILRDQMLSAEATAGLTAGLDDWHLLAKMTEEQYLGGALSALGWLHHRQNGRRTIYLQSYHATGLFDGSHGQVRDLVAAVRKARGQGVLVQMAEDRGGWLTLAAFGYYMQRGRTTAEEDRAFFVELVRRRFGDGVPVEALLDAGDAAGRILPTVRRQFFSRNWHYKARFGLLLDQMMSMPTASSFDHYNSGGVGFVSWLPRGYRFERDRLTVGEAVESERLTYTNESNQGTPAQTVDDLRRFAEVIEGVLPQLRPAKPQRGARQWSRQLNDLEFLAALSRFYASKTEAGLAWGRWSAGLTTGSEVIDDVDGQLGESIGFYRMAIEAYDRSYPQPQRVMMVNSGESSGWSYAGEVHGGMNELDGLFKLERDGIRARMERGERSLPTFRELYDQIPRR